jgi:hypothetical protein
MAHPTDLLDSLLPALLLWGPVWGSGEGPLPLLSCLPVLGAAAGTTVMMPGSLLPSLLPAAPIATADWTLGGGGKTQCVCAGLYCRTEYGFCLRFITRQNAVRVVKSKLQSPGDDLHSVQPRTLVMCAIRLPLFVFCVFY